MRDDRGATAIIIALLMVPMLGFAALSVDVGAMYVKKRELQNGADAAALAIAQDCAAESPACNTYGDTAHQLADENARSTPSATVTKTDGTVTVTVGDTVDHFFAPVIGIDSSDVAATASAAWGGPSAGPAVLPITFAYCGFEGQIGVHQVIRYDENRPDCPGTDIPGGFGWIVHEGGCRLDRVAVDEVLPSDTGNSPAGDCVTTLDAMRADLEAGEDVTVILPVHDAGYGGGSGGTYKITGFAAFSITGWRLGGGSEWTYNTSCTGNCRGIEGEFVEYVTLDTDFEQGGPDLGAEAVRLTD